MDIRVSLSTLSTHQYWAAILLLYTNVWLFFFISVLSVFFDVIIVGCFSSLPPLSRLTSSFNNKLTKCCSLFWSQFSDRWVPNFVFNLDEKLKEKRTFFENESYLWLHVFVFSPSLSRSSHEQLFWTQRIKQHWNIF